MNKKSYILLILLTILASCSYSVRYNALPHLKTVRIEPFDNQTEQTGLENDVFEQLVAAFAADNRLRVVYEKGDAFLQGEILSYEEKQIAEEEIRLTVSFSVTFWETPDKLIWKTEKSAFYANFPATEQDLAAERMANRDEAVDKIIADLSEKIFSEVLEDW